MLGLPVREEHETEEKARAIETEFYIFIITGQPTEHSNDGGIDLFSVPPLSTFLLPGK